MKKATIFLVILSLFTITGGEIFGSTISISSISADPGDTAVMVSISLDNSTPYYGSEMELQYNSSLLDLNRIEFASRLSSISEVEYYEYTTGKVSSVFFDLTGQSLPADTGTIMNAYFDVSPDAGQEDAEISISEITAVTDGMEYDTVETTSGAIRIPVYICGDVDLDRVVNIFDIVYIIQFLYLEGPPPESIESANVNGDATVNIFDITYLIGNLYLDGPPLDCAPVEKSYASEVIAKIAEGEECATIYSSFDKDKTTINIESPSDVYGIEMILESSDGSKLELKSLKEGIPVYYSQSNDQIKLGMVDINGKRFMAKGKNRIIEIDGKVEVVSILASDKNSQSIPFKSSSVIVPREYSLDQNYPNPFNPSTEIKFALPQASNVSLEIFNILGRRVTTLINDRLDAGYHSVTWDGINSKGQDVATGVYLYRLKAGDFVKSKKMLLLK